VTNEEQEEMRTGAELATATESRGLTPVSTKDGSQIEIEALISERLRQRVSEHGVNLLSVLRTAAIATLSYWSKPIAESASLLEMAKKPLAPPASAEGACEVKLELTAGDESESLTLPFDLPRDVQDAGLRHQIALDANVVRLSLKAEAGHFPKGMLEELLQAEKWLLEQLAAGACWNERRSQLVSAAGLAAREALNATKAPISDDLLHDAFERQVQKTPEAPAVITVNRTISYVELDRRVEHVARKLRSLNASHEHPIAVVMQKGWQQVVAVLAIHRAGSFYVPVDADLPTDRAHFLIANAGADVVVTQPGLDGVFTWPGNLRARVVVEDAAPEISGPRLERAKVHPDELAYIIYTSGSTGVPKGVAITHRGAVNTCIDINRRFEVTAKDRVLALSSLSFDLSVWDVFGLLGIGATIVVPEAAEKNDPRHWAHLVISAGVTIWNSVPALMDLYVHDLAHNHKPIPSTLRLVMMSGDWIPLGLPSQIRALKKDTVVMSLGGATEASIWSIYYPVEELDPKWRSIPYGRPLANQTFHVFNQDMLPSPTWVPGQLFIGGIGLAQEYWKDETKTNKAFIRHPDTGERLYRTGDLGRYLPSGDIEFLGREDSQVKVRGFRVELGEIERVMLQHPAVRECVVLYNRVSQGNGRLTAYVVDPSGHAVKVSELREFLKTKLPDYMVPSELVTIDHMPLTKNGKVDRGALAKLAEARAIEERPAPRDEIEARLIEIFEKVLEKKGVSPRDNFFELGGDSILVVDLFHLIEERFKTTLPLTLIVGAPTVAQIAEVIRSGAKESSSLVTLRPKGAHGTIFCVHSGDGEVICYRQMAARLPGVGVYGFQTRRPGSGGEPHLTVEEMAAAYIVEMVAFQPEGPYHLAGHSFGGVVVLEMARQLEAQGKRVGLVAMFDSYAPVCAPRTRTPRYTWMWTLWRMKQHLLRLRRPSDALQYWGEQARARWRKLSGAPSAPPDPKQVCTNATYRYLPAPYAGLVTIFRTKEPQDEIHPYDGEPDMGWTPILARTEILDVSGSHLTMLTEPHVRRLASLLAPKLGAQG
jgi:amino acid adenylation domain-containing protein